MDVLQNRGQDMDQGQGFHTRAIHVGQAPDPTTGATVPPIYATSTYTQSGLGEHKGYEYGRGDNPTRQALEEVMASLEKGLHAAAYASGLAASDAVLRLLAPGQEVIAGEDLYGGVYRLFERIYRSQGLSVEYVDLLDLDRLESRVSPKTRMIWLETPTNPLLQIFDIEAIAEIAHRKGLWLVVDNTFASPYLQNPLDHGADIVVHSTTKYVAGHSDVLGGMVVVRDREIYDRLKFLQNAAGAILGPFEAWLTLRGLKTLGVRMQRHCDNAEQVAKFLSSHPDVERVYYPKFGDLRQKQLAEHQMRAFGGMVSFTLKDKRRPTVERVLKRFSIFSLAESLGGVESLVGHPATMTHAAIPLAEREARGITEGLIRLSVGIEDLPDLIQDLTQALTEVHD